MSYIKGELVRCSGFFSRNGTAITPTTVTAIIKTPAGVETEYLYGTDPEIQIDDQGRYYVDVNASIAGRWWYRFESTGDGQAAAEGAFDVKAGQF